MAEAEDNIQKMYKYFGILIDAKENVADVSFKPFILYYFKIQKSILNHFKVDKPVE